MPPTLNDDCWSIVLDQLYGDFQTLARMMHLSRHFLSISAPVLYRQLGDAANRDQIKSWSDNKRNRFSALLLTSSGFLAPAPISTNTNKAEEKHNHSDDEEESDEEESDEFQSSCRHFRYKTPLLMDYFGFLSRLPTYLVGAETWRQLMSAAETTTDIGGNTHSEQLIITQRHASKLSEICVQDLLEIEKWLPMVERLERLETLLIDGIEEPTCLAESIVEKLQEFVNRHRIAFPGQLKEIKTTLHFEAEKAMGLNRLLGQPEKFDLRLYDGILEEFGAERDESEHNGNSWSNLFRSIKELKFLEVDSRTLTSRDPEAVARILTTALQQCRQLEKLTIRGHYGSDVWARKVFAWARRELNQSSVKATSPTMTTMKTTTAAEISATRSVHLKSFAGVYLPVSLLIDVMDGFRNSLERVDFSAIPQARILSLHWSGSMKCLKVLKLSGCYVQLIKLEKFCPNLEEFSLSRMQPVEQGMSSEDYVELHRQYLLDISTSDDIGGVKTVPFDDTFDCNREVQLAKQPWRPVLPSLKILKFSKMLLSTKLDLLSIGKLKRLEELCLGDKEHFEMDEKHAIDRLESVRFLDWDLRHLKRLQLLDSNVGWHRVLLRAAPNLEYWSSTGAVFLPSLLVGFWQETRLQTLETLVQLEQRMNKDRFVDEEEYRLKKEGMFSDCKTLTGQDIWNAHISNLRSLAFDGWWRAKNMQDFEKFVTSGDWKRVAANDSDNSVSVPVKETLRSEADSSISRSIITTMESSGTTASNPGFGLYDRICFPKLSHVDFSSAITNGIDEGIDDLVKHLLWRRGMVRVVAPWSLLTSEFLQTLQEINEASIPSKWESQVDGDDHDVDSGSKKTFCVLELNTFLGLTRYFRLKD